MRDATRPVVLLTGFGPFPGVMDNASARLVEALAPAARVAFPQVDIHHAILPAEWSAAPMRLDALIAALRPPLMLHFGVAQNCPGFRIETRAQNACLQTTDAAGLLPASQWLAGGGAASHDVTLPAAAIVARLTERGFPTTLSRDAGAYLCNAILYHSLRYAQSAPPPCCAGFIHIPEKWPGSDLSFPGALTGGLEILRVCLETAAVNA